MLTELTRSLSALGLILRGGFHPAPEDEVPALPDGGVARTLLVIGNAGPQMWQVFSGAPERSDGRADPLDRWTERSLGPLAAGLGAAAHYPSDGPPYRPFLRWAQKAEGLRASPLGMLIHPRYGLWHAYRAAFVFQAVLKLPQPDEAPSPCETCADKPCLTTCPVSAFQIGRYDVPACVAHIGSAEGRPCLTQGCLARRVCPIGRDFSYDPPQAAFHMEAFLASRRVRGA